MKNPSTPQLNLDRFQLTDRERGILCAALLYLSYKREEWSSYEEMLVDHIEILNLMTDGDNEPEPSLDEVEELYQKLGSLQNG